jgi:ribosomal protein L3 glutamine methyltransferase
MVRSLRNAPPAAESGATSQSGTERYALDHDTELAQLLTVRDWLRYAVSRFNAAKVHFGHGSQDVYDEAAYLVLRALHLPLDRLEPFLDARLLEHERNAVLDLIRRRSETRIPAAYLTREAWLGDFRFYVDERVIVPRSYFGELLEDGLAPWIPDPDRIGCALDLCTGSGCLAILMAHAFSHARIDATDISADALAVAHRNVADYDLLQRITLVHSDLFAALDGRRYDLIISNPPYVDGESMRRLPAEYRHEPQLALEAGDDGLDAVRHILVAARQHLNAKGMLAVEVGHNRAAVEAAYPKTAFTWLESRSGGGMVFLLQRHQLP